MDQSRIEQALKGSTIPRPQSRIEDLLADISNKIDGGVTKPDIGFVPTAYTEDGKFKEGIWYGDTMPPFAMASATDLYEFILASTNMPAEIIQWADQIGFEGSFDSLEKVKFDGSPTTISKGAFACNMGLTSIDIPQSVTEIGAEAFMFCLKLESINFPEGITKIGSKALIFTSVSVINLPSTLEEIEIDTDNTPPIYSINALHVYCNWVEGDKPNIETVLQTCCSGGTEDGKPIMHYLEAESDPTKIPAGAYKNDLTLTTFEVPSTVTEIGDEAFMGCANLTSITLPEGLTTIGERVFSGCSALTEINIPSTCNDSIDIADSGITTIRYDEGWLTTPFMQINNSSAISRVILPQSLETIGSSSFQYFNITNLVIPKNVKTIEGSAFWYCYELTTVTFEGTPDYMDYDIFRFDNKLTIMNVPWSESDNINRSNPWDAPNLETINYNYTPTT